MTNFDSSPVPSDHAAPANRDALARDAETEAVRVRTRRWMRAVGVFYMLQFVAMVVVRAPIRTFGPEGALDLASAGDPVARFLVDTWFIFGMEVGAVGVALLVLSRWPERAWALIWAVVAIDAGRGVLTDAVMVVRGIEPAGYAVWIVIHGVVILTGLRLLAAQRRADPAGAGWGR